MNERHEVKSLKKALRALIFMNQHGDVTVSDVAKAIGVPRPTSYRILETLDSEGYIEKQPHSVFYRMTSRVRDLSAGFQNQDLLLEVARPMIARLGCELGWPIALATPRGRSMVVRITTEFESALALERRNVGFAVPIMLSTAGYCYLAHCTEAEREDAIAHPDIPEDFAANYPPPGEGRYLSIRGELGHLLRFNRSRRDELLILIDQVREAGFCNLEFKEYREGNVGVPLIVDGKVVGGLVMRYIKTAMNKTDRIRSTYVPRLKELAENIIDAYDDLRGQSQPVEGGWLPRPVADVFYPKFG